MGRTAKSVHPSCKACQDPTRTPFASETVFEHLVRGAGAVLLILLGTLMMHLRSGWEATFPAAGCWVAAAVLLRGCPVCWLIGLVETVNDRPSREGPRHRGGQEDQTDLNDRMVGRDWARRAADVIATRLNS